MSSSLYLELTEKELTDIESASLQTCVMSAKLLTGVLFNTTYLVETGNSGKVVLRAGPVNRHLLMPFEHHLMEAWEGCIHSVLFDENGEFLVRTGFLSTYLASLKRVLLKDCPAKPGTEWYCDGFTSDNKPILYACYFDLQRIYSYRNKLDMDRLG